MVQYQKSHIAKVKVSHLLGTRAPNCLLASIMGYTVVPTGNTVFESQLHVPEQWYVLSIYLCVWLCLFVCYIANAEADKGADEEAENTTAARRRSSRIASEQTQQNTTAEGSLVNMIHQCICKCLEVCWLKSRYLQDHSFTEINLTLSWELNSLLVPRIALALFSLVQVAVILIKHASYTIRSGRMRSK